LRHLKGDFTVSTVLKTKCLIGCTLTAALFSAGCATTSATPAASPAFSITYDPAAKEQYRKILTQVLQKNFASKPGPDICLPPLFGFGENVSDTAEVLDAEASFQAVPGMPGMSAATSRPAQFKALESAGLVSSTESTRTFNNKTQRVLIYRRTAKGLASSQGPSLCYARGELDQLVKWKGPAVLGEYQVAFVYYTIKVTHVEDWVKSAEIQAAFPATVPIVRSDAGKVRQTVIDLSSEGWDIAEWAKYMQLQ
jgi:hypothetical protein